jgi:hypothetical protein
MAPVVDVAMAENGRWLLIKPSRWLKSKPITALPRLSAKSLPIRAEI